MTAASYIRLHEPSMRLCLYTKTHTQTKTLHNVEHGPASSWNMSIPPTPCPQRPQTATDLALSAKLTALCDTTTRAHLPSIVCDKGWKGVSRKDTSTLYSLPLGISSRFWQGKSKHIQLTGQAPRNRERPTRFGIRLPREWVGRAPPRARNRQTWL